ncbi:MAG: UDP-N-acetylmuramoyl-L-alanine--D-glutamate ligase [Ignavibacteria bacterium]|nr:UDP-N-acetylmuramoyl-L-alanine--D-glutamate ligase [Ignavibacteria bacterium]
MEKNIRELKISVIGAARSGIAAALLAARKGAKVLLSDGGNPNLTEKVFNQLRDASVEIEFNGHTEKVYDCDFIVTSPGVPLNSKVLSEAFSRGIKVYSELEFASWFAQGKIIAITGTNGKTTTTALTYHILKNAGFNVFIGGNIGEAFSNFVDQTKSDTISVLEVSSFQLDLIDTFHPNVAVLLNITPDHLERYDNDFSKYINSKFRITKNLTQNDLFIYNRDDESITKNFRRGEFLTQSFSVIDTNFATAFYSDGKIFIHESEIQDLPEAMTEKNVFVIDTNEMYLKGIHNYYNSMAAILAAKFVGAELNQIREGLASFRGVEHRLEVVRRINGVLYINDSKATNVRSTYYALKSYDAPIILILGGREKGNDYSEIKELVEQKVKLIIAFGESKEKIKNYFDTITKVLVCNSLEEVVLKSKELALPGDVVLFSPACKSFDMFIDFEDRGRKFKELVNQL